MSRLLVVAYYTPPLGLSGVMRVTKLCKFLPEFGWEPLILTVKDVAYYAYDPELLRDLQGSRIFRTESLDPNRILRLLGIKVIGEKEIGRGRGWLQGVFYPDSKIGWLPFAVRAGMRIIRKYEPRVIFATAPPWTCLIVGERLARDSGLPLILDFRDPWPRGFQTPAQKERARLEMLKRRILNRAQLVLAVNKATAKQVGGKVEVLDNGFDPDEFEVEPERLAGFSILYAGNLEAQAREVAAVIGALSRVPDARLYIAGRVDGASARLLAGQGQVEVLGVLAHRRVLSLMKGADVLLYLGKPGQGVGLKLYEYLGSGRPVIVWAERESEPAALVQETGTGLVCSDPTGFVECLKAIRENPGRFAGRGVERFNRRFQAKRLAEYLTALEKAGQFSPSPVSPLLKGGEIF